MTGSSSFVFSADPLAGEASAGWNINVAKTLI
jgi:hypothetical protein